MANEAGRDALSPAGDAGDGPFGDRIVGGEVLDGLAGARLTKTVSIGRSGRAIST
ncbi:MULTISPECIES: hypothetical protein [unclassified Mesorhizobium]|uniref:hypothetical protein n=1 Tax=unclassified Mesorhizobium TaxID=325217 RepID=UPI001FE0D227|nr:MULTISPECIES: hypothetical protein [unclassified Mesorhizobium]MDF3156705.1 hypothetical protein [Mesorhizobium sp. XAP10]MDF3249373.1 hypothetical protein [Mesorhizobium sp. XAP4]